RVLAGKPVRGRGLGGERLPAAKRPFAPRRTPARGRAWRRRARRRALLGARAPASAARRERRGDLGLAVGADRPALIERAPAGGAALLQLAQAARAAQEVALDPVVAVGAEAVVERGQPRFGGLHLQLT